MATAIFRPGDRPLLNLGLLGATACTTFATYRLVMATGPSPLSDSLAFAMTLLLILGSHEMGHYLLARYHGVDTSLP
jgi:hypothetical protein